MNSTAKYNRNRKARRRNKRLWLTCLPCYLCCALAQVGCSSEKPTPEKEQTTTWALDSFEQAGQLLMAVTSAEVKVSETQIIYSQEPVALEVLVNKANTSLKEGEVWARYDLDELADIIKQTSELIAEAESRIEQHLEIDLPQKLLELQTAINKAEEAQRLKAQIDNNETLSKNPVITGMIDPQVKQGISAEQLELLRKQKAHLEEQKDTPPLELQNKLDALREQLEAFKKLQADAELSMPFDGTLHILLPEFDGRGTYEPLPRQPVAQYDLDDSILFQINASTPYLAEVPSKRLTLRHIPVGKEPTLATYAEQKIVWHNNQRNRFLAFDPPQPEAYLKQIDTYLQIDVLYDLGQTCHIIPKLTLLDFHQDNTKPDWKSILAKVQPDYQIVAEGPVSIAIAPREMSTAKTGQSE